MSLQRGVSIAVLAAVVAVAAVLVWQTDANGPQVLWLGAWQEPLGISLVADRLSHRRQGAGRRRHGIELATAVVGDDETVHAGVDGAARVLRVEHALHHQLPGPEIAHPCDVFPGDTRVELRVHP